jgi:hypothetical protein
VSGLFVVPPALLAPARAAGVAAELLSGVARALRRHVVHTGRSDSGDAVAELVLSLAARADLLAQEAATDAEGVRAAAGVYTAAERRAMEP